jgi:hypothetical protein
MMAHCHCLFLLKHKEEGIAIAFFAITPLEKKVMVASCHRLLLLLKHREDDYNSNI